MRCVVVLPASPKLVRLTFVAALALGTAACSADSTRMSEGYAAGKRPSTEVTGSVVTQPAAPAISSTSLPPLSGSPQTAQSVPQPPPQVTATTSPPATRATTPALAKPVPSAGTATTTTHTVVAGDTLHKIARKYQVSVSDLLAANKRDRLAKLKLGEQLVIPTGQPAPQNPPAATKANTAEKSGKPNSTDKRPAGPIINKLTEAPESVVENKGTVAPTLTFRRPVNGRVISGFGPKPDGTENLGVNFSVPEGTPIKAAEDGVVAYASNELKSFGNLVMIRHANGYVTTYAHANEILVKRDEPVKRGQVIAKSGQTGTVKGGPQLHFEIRKGATPVDPMPFLEHATN